MGHPVYPRRMRHLLIPAAAQKDDECAYIIYVSRARTSFRSRLSIRFGRISRECLPGNTHSRGDYMGSGIRREAVFNIGRDSSWCGTELVDAISGACLIGLSATEEG